MQSIPGLEFEEKILLPAVTLIVGAIGTALANAFRNWLKHRETKWRPVRSGLSVLLLPLCLAALFASGCASTIRAGGDSLERIKMAEGIYQDSPTSTYLIELEWTDFGASLTHPLEGGGIPLPFIGWKRGRMFGLRIPLTASEALQYISERNLSSEFTGSSVFVNGSRTMLSVDDNQYLKTPAPLVPLVSAPKPDAARVPSVE
jgi:hypothetical protein